jgi:hypothetical protein
MGMLSLSDVICANEQQVAAKIMDGEAILIHLGTGAYYSMGAAGGFIWSLVENQLSLEDVVAAVTERYEVARDRAEADVLRLSEQLCAEGLALVRTGTAATGAVPPASGARLAYDAPALEKFTDMAEMFALDPPLPGLSKAATDARKAKG